jgi:hypothetical protein
MEADGDQSPARYYVLTRGFRAEAHHEVDHRRLDMDPVPRSTRCA